MWECFELHPLPRRCIECEEAKEGEAMGLTPDAYCYNCDYELMRFAFYEADDEGNFVRLIEW